MAVRVPPRDKIPAIVGDWRTGEYTQTALALKYGVSEGFVNKHVKGVEKDTAPIVKALVESRQALALLPEKTVSAVSDAVHEQTKHLAFFAHHTIQNCTMMMKKISKESDLSEHALVQRTLRDGRETVMGKESGPQQNVQVNTGITVVISEVDSKI